MASKKKRQSVFKDVKLARPQLKQLEFLKNQILIGKNTLCVETYLYYKPIALFFICN